METDKYVFFYGHSKIKSNHNVFSQWYICAFVETLNDGTQLEYSSTEQYMMAHKAILFNDAECLAKILASNDPKDIKAMGRKIRNFNEKKWDKYKLNIVIKGNRLKFGQNPDLMKILLKTGNKMIVEASPYDKIWGIGLNASDAIKTPVEQWPGQNLLGKALMAVRSGNLGKT